MNPRLLAIALAVLPLGAVQANGYTVDPAHTYANFKISHLGFSTMYGRMDVTGGTMQFDPAGKKASVEITIDANSIDTGHGKRDDHLRSPDFLNAAEFPTITFKSTGVTWNGSTPATVTGDLTILGVSKPVTLKVDAMNCGNHPFTKKPMCGFDASATIKRTDWGVKYGVPAIGEQMGLMLEFEATQD